MNYVKIRSYLACVLIVSTGGVVGADETRKVDTTESDPVFSLPGADPFPVELEMKFLDAIDAKGPGYKPRTRHVWENGSPKFTNRLVLESSPYLQQHAHNPVNWYPWGDEAFETARRLGRPVLLSIGYSTCHWCHVMEEESFEDEEIAGFLNANYIAIKVDREERPDVDAVYMSAVQMLTGRGGWPMTTWLTPDREVFYGGTYFPPRDGARGRRPGFLTLLGQLKQLYDTDRENVVEQATSLTRRIRLSMEPTAGDKLPAEDTIELAAEQYASMFDSVNGGLKRAPKFPSSMPNRLLLRQYLRTGDKKWLEMATLTLRKMAGGGMYDQVGGGFHRYSTDGQWLVPHFEKMLYDNALLTVAYLEAYQVTDDPEFARVSREVLDYVELEMTSDIGGFYSATDADSLGPDGEREEGWFFTWTPAEIRAVVGEKLAARIEAYYGVTAKGNFEGRTILNVARPAEAVAAELGISLGELKKSIETARAKMYQARQSRPAPLLDDKILTSWNGLMISAFAVGGFVLDAPEYTARAERAAAFLLDRMVVDGRLRRSFKDGRARHAAYLDDYAFLIQGLLDLYETTSNLRWLESAVALQKQIDEHYLDASSGGYFMTGDDAENLLAREKPSYDGAEPSGNSVELLNLLRLGELTTAEKYRVAAERMLKTFGDRLERSPRALSEMLIAVDFHRARAKEVVIVVPHGASGDHPLVRTLRGLYVPNKVVTVLEEGKEIERHAQLVPWVAGKVARDGKVTAYVCQDGVCQLPTNDSEVFARQLIGLKPPGS